MISTIFSRRGTPTSSLGENDSNFIADEAQQYVEILSGTLIHLSLLRGEENMKEILECKTLF